MTAIYAGFINELERADSAGKNNFARLNEMDENASANYPDAAGECEKGLTQDDSESKRKMERESSFGSWSCVPCAGLFYSSPNYPKHPSAVKPHGRKADGSPTVPAQGRRRNGWNALSAYK